MNTKQLFFLLLAVGVFEGFRWVCAAPPDEFISFQFKKQNFLLTARNTLDTTRFSGRGALSKGKLDTLSNVFYAQKNYVEIIRQDDLLRPSVGIALGFEFDESNGDYPYTPAYAVVQFRDFRHGGVMFEKRDSFNFTGVSNDVSDDLDIEILHFEHDTMIGKFHGLLISGAGSMREISEGYFKVFLFRK